jgi:hypothetical protein
VNNWPMTAEDGRICDLLARGEAVPGGPGACAREGCHHLTLWHRGERDNRSYRKQPCRKCRCPGWTDEVGAEMPPEPPVQGMLFDVPERAA